MKDMASSEEEQIGYAQIEAIAWSDDGQFNLSLEAAFAEDCDASLSSVAAMLGCRRDSRASAGDILKRNVFTLRPVSVNAFLPWRGSGGVLPKRTVSGSAELRILADERGCVLSGALRTLTDQSSKKALARRATDQTGVLTQTSGPKISSRDVVRTADLVLSSDFREVANRYSMDLSTILDRTRDGLDTLAESAKSWTRQGNRNQMLARTARVQAVCLLELNQNSELEDTVKKEFNSELVIHNSETVLRVRISEICETESDVTARLQFLRMKIESISVAVLALEELRRNIDAQTTLLRKLMSGASRDSTISREEWEDTYAEILELRANCLLKLAETSSLINDEMDRGSTEWVESLDSKSASLRDDFEQLGRELSLLPQASSKRPAVEEVRQADAANASSIEILEMRNVFKQIRGVMIQRRHGEDRGGQMTPRSIELHPFLNRDSIFQEMQASLMVTTLMTATCGIILGVLIQNAAGAVGKSIWSLQSSSLQWDFGILFVATFAFFYSTLICANAVGRLARQSTTLIDHQLDRAAAYSEYLGKYPFVISVTMVLITVLGEARIWVQLLVGILGWLLVVSYSTTKGIAMLTTDFGDGRIGSDSLRRIIQGVVVFLSLSLMVVLPILSADLKSALALTWLSVGTGISTVLMLSILATMTWLSTAMPTPSDALHFKVHSWDRLGRERDSW